MGTGVGRGVRTGRLSALVFGTAALLVLFQMVLQTFPSVMREGLVVDLSLNEAGFGGLSSSFYYPYILLQIPAGIMVARFGARAVATSLAEGPAATRAPRAAVSGPPPEPA